VRAPAWAAPVDNPVRQLDAAAAGAELVELELEPLDEGELDFSDVDEELSDDDELVDSELVDEPLDELLADSRLSLR
jgi:hypothetical protein